MQVRGPAGVILVTPPRCLPRFTARLRSDEIAGDRGELQTCNSRQSTDDFGTFSRHRWQRYPPKLTRVRATRRAAMIRVRKARLTDDGGTIPKTPSEEEPR